MNKKGNLIGIKLKENRIIDIISEKNAVIEINDQNWDYVII
jgi:hypothetical protein